MRRLGKLLLTVCLLLGLCACEPAGETTSQGDYRLYFISDDEEGDAWLGSEGWTPQPGEEDLPLALLEALLEGPRAPHLASPFPTGLELRQLERKGSQVRLDFTELYESLSPLDQAMANACLALTICQVEGVDSVRVTIQGVASPYLCNGALRADDIRLAGSEGQDRQVTVSLWFPRQDGRGLGVEYRTVTYTEREVLSDMVLRALIAGPEDQELRPILPEGTELKGTYTEKNICYAELTGDFFAHLPEDKMEQTLLAYSLVNSLCGGVESVEQVVLVFDGQPLKLGDLPEGPIEPDFELVAHDDLMD